LAGKKKRINQSKKRGRKEWGKVEDVRRIKKGAGKAIKK